MLTYEKIENKMLKKAVDLNVVPLTVYEEEPKKRLAVVMEMVGRQITTDCTKRVYGDSAETAIKYCKFDCQYDLDYGTTRKETKVRYNPKYDTNYFKENGARVTGCKPEHCDRVEVITTDGEYIEWVSTAYYKTGTMPKPRTYCDTSRGMTEANYYEYSYNDRLFSCPVPKWNLWKPVLDLIDKRYKELNNVSEP